MSENHNVINVKNILKDESDLRVSQDFINETADILETIARQIAIWGNNAADATENKTLLISHVPYYLVDRKDAIDRAIQAYYDKVDIKESRRREREAKKSSKKMREIIDKDNKLKESIQDE